MSPDLSSTFSSASNDAAATNAGSSMKFPLCSCDAINDSTSRRKFASPEQASERNESRSSGRYESAELKISLTCCQRSGFISLCLLQLEHPDVTRGLGIFEDDPVR